MERITSSQNPLLRHIRKLQSSGAYRRQWGEFVADGFKLLEEALRWYPKIKTVVVSEGCNLPPLPERVRRVEIPASLMMSLSEMKTPQGVLFTCELPKAEAPKVEKGMLLLDRIQDPGNLGTILRTADALGVQVLLTNGCADAYSLKTLRASMGAVLRTTPRSLPMEMILTACKENEIPIAATALTHDAVDIRTIAPEKYLMVIGSEGQGVSNELLTAAQTHVIIPMEPRCESLNAAIAATIVMWQMKR
ncbi:MAG: TrmH family RNA methyltransferase [Faecousia sp.]